jgi:hypothetical protein
MTFQVVLLGSDGVLVGSDKLITSYTPSLPEKPSPRQSQCGDKFFESPDGGLVVTSWAGGNYARTFAREVALETEHHALGPLYWEDYLDKKAKNSSCGGGNQALVIRRQPIISVMWVIIGQLGGASPVTDKICIGFPSSASFLTKHFWNRRPVDSLIPLALLVLDYAAEENPAAVGGGYDLMVLRGDLRAEWKLDCARNQERVSALRRAFENSVKAAIEGHD